MEAKFQKVKDFFEKEAYLSNRVNIEMRKTIVKEFFPSMKNKRILDIGCGDGSISLQFASMNEVILLDGATQMLDAAKRNLEKTGNAAQVTFVQGDILQFDDEKKFDVILCIGVISHIQNVSQLLHKINSLLKLDGQVIIQFSNIDHFVYRLKRRFGSPDTYGYKLNTFNSSTFFELTRQAGFISKDKKGYSWQHPPINRLKPSLQFRILNRFRENLLLSFLNSEWLVLFVKK